MRYVVIATTNTTYHRMPFNTKMGARYMAFRLVEGYGWDKADVVDTETGEVLMTAKRA